VSQFFFRSPRAYRLRAVAEREEDALSLLMVSASNRNVLAPYSAGKLDFFGGTMFWVHPEALRPLRDLRLAADILNDIGLVDGNLPHALERVLPTLVLAAGYKLADSDGYGVATSGLSL
jgi:lipopolysaccharide biosynthesis protein